MGPEQNYGYNAPSYSQAPAQKNKFKLIIIGAVAVMVLIMIIAVVAALLAPPAIRPDVSKIAAMHTEISRVAELGIKSKRAQETTQNIAAVARSSSLSSVTLLEQYASEAFSEPLSKGALKAEENSGIDAILTQAEDVNNYDAKFEEVMLELLTQTNIKVVDLFEKADDVELKTMLNLIGTNNELIIDSLEAN